MCSNIIAFPLEKSAEVETDSLYGESVGDTQEKKEKGKTS
jgi:hypothetical protein